VFGISAIDHQSELLGSAERGYLAIHIPSLDFDPHGAVRLSYSG